MKTIKTLLLAGMFALGLGSCGKKLPNEHLLPSVKGNQKLVLDEDYIDGKIPLGYTLYTDQNRDGLFDTFKKVWVGNTPNSPVIVYGRRKDIISSR